MEYKSYMRRLSSKP